MTNNELNTTANYEHYLCNCGEFYTDEDHTCYYTTEADDEGN